MKFLSLEIENFGVYEGAHRFDFSAPEALEQEADVMGAARNVVLVRGHNGAGKSTLFGAFALALHGAGALGERVSRAEGNEFLLGRFHRKSRGEIAATARVALAFEYVESGRPARLEVERRWNRNGRVVTEEIAVRCDGAKPDGIKSADYNGYLADLFPPNLSPVCFFDAERLDALASVEHGEGLLGATMRRLLGIDVVERLREDLDIYTFRQGGRDLEPLRAAVFESGQLKAQAEERWKTAQAELETLEAQIAQTRAQIADTEAQLSSSGGTYAQRRPQLIERRQAIAEEIEALERELRELCEGLLPFALAPALCRQLETRLSFEADNAQNRLLHGFWAAQLARVEGVIAGQTFADSELAGQIVAALRADEPTVSASPQIHVISDLERDKLRGWLGQIADEVPRTSGAVTQELRALRAELGEVTSDLARAPEDDALASLHQTIAALEEQLSATTRAHGALSVEIGALQYAYTERERHYNKAVEEFLTAQKTGQKLALAERSKRALRVYKDTLTRNQLARLEKSVAQFFNRLCQKERLLASVVIDPDTWALSAQDGAGRKVGLGDFSAGERQIYSLSLLWALREISGRQMPLLIDTPLGRLDEHHRAALLTEFFPHVARQVFLFTTTAEVDASILEQLEPMLSRHYALKFDAHSEGSHVESVPVSPQFAGGRASGALQSAGAAR